LLLDNIVWGCPQPQKTKLRLIREGEKKGKGVQGFIAEKVGDVFPWFMNPKKKKEGKKKAS